MVSTRVALFGLLLLLGFMNNRIGARLQGGDASAPVLRLRRFAEAEIGIRLTVFFAAASLTSVPPAADLVNEPVTPAEILQPIAPRIPTLTQPDHETLANPKLQSGAASPG